MFDINPGLIIWTIIVFALLASVLGRFAWKPMLKALSDREDGIRDALSQAEKARAEAQELLKQNASALAQAEEASQRLIREGKSVAEKMKEEIVAKAREQAQREIARANEEIQRNVDAAKQQLRGEVADLAVKAAEKILDETLDADRQKKLIDAMITRMPGN